MPSIIVVETANANTALTHGFGGAFSISVDRIAGPAQTYSGYFPLYTAVAAAIEAPWSKR
jgi:hypothetical protein